MQNPKILGRMDDDDTIDERSSTSHICTAEVPFEGGACGKVTVKVFKSDNDEDRGGLVFRITLDDLASAFIPHTVALENGIELHMAGDIEARSLVQALKKALSSL
ncbi:hypothetical protein [Comamonas aquatica]|uniref:hypothetical protein n=1 Tax=Comamonas aquatica TaxID=225991 RepID=UPI0012EACF1C|nr:hypothetical protein [Comamonas aquatica]